MMKSCLERKFLAVVVGMIIGALLVVLIQAFIGKVKAAEWKWGTRYYMVTVPVPISVLGDSAALHQAIRDGLKASQRTVNIQVEIER